MNDSLVVGIFFLMHPEKIIFYSHLLKISFFFDIFNILETFCSCTQLLCLKAPFFKIFLKSKVFEDFCRCMHAWDPSPTPG